MSKLAYVVIFLSNLWIWRILNNNVYIFVLLVLLYVLLFYLTKSYNKKLLYTNLFILAVLSIFQIKTTTPTNLTLITNEDRLVIDTRLNEYPPVSFGYKTKRVWIPAAYWLEARGETIAWSRIKSSFFEILSINNYFFANHPRQRVGYTEFEKFPYIMLPFFLTGLYFFIKDKKIFMFIFLLIPLLLVSVVGDRNMLGVLLLYPFIATAVAYGVSKTYLLVNYKFPKKKYILYFVFAVILAVVLMQNYLYETAV